MVVQQRNEERVKVRVLSIKPSAPDDTPMGPGKQFELEVLANSTPEAVYKTGTIMGRDNGERVCGYFRFVVPGIEVGDDAVFLIKEGQDKIKGIQRFFISTPGYGR